MGGGLEPISSLVFVESAEEWVERPSILSKAAGEVTMVVRRTSSSLHIVAYRAEDVLDALTAPDEMAGSGSSQPWRPRRPRRPATIDLRAGDL